MNLLKKLRKSILRIYKKYFERGKIDKFPVFYIKGNQTLPPPLDPREEEKILKDLENNEEAKQILAQRNLRLVVYIAKKFENTGMDINRNNWTYESYKYI